MIGPHIRGVAPLPVHTELEAGCWNAAVPSYCVVPLQQHTGSRLESLVQPGEVVREGMPLAESGSRLAVPLHAPIPGRIAEIGAIQLLDGTTSPAISIELDGEFDRLGKTPEPHPWRDLSPDTVIELVRAAGVVGSPRVTVPAHVLLRSNPLGSNTAVVLDVAETEPYLGADAELAALKPDHVIEALEIAARALGTEDIHVVVAEKFRRAYRALRAVESERHIRFHRVPHRYPANAVAALRSLVRGSSRDARQARQQELAVLSPSTAEAIFDAVVYRKPQIDRVVAVGGGAVRRPAYIRVRIGTSVADVLAECGGLTEEPARIVAGGTLTGSLVSNVRAPITKGTAAIVALTESEVQAGSEEPCINCGACVRACPVSVNPVLLHDLIIDGRQEDAIASGLFDCSECGLCSHVCPSRIPLVGRLQAGKRLVSDKGAAV